jgi:hypothetical protein
MIEFKENDVVRVTQDSYYPWLDGLMGIVDTVDLTRGIKVLLPHQESHWFRWHQLQLEWRQPEGLTPEVKEIPTDVKREELIKWCEEHIEYWSMRAGSSLETHLLAIIALLRAGNVPKQFGLFLMKHKDRAVFTCTYPDGRTIDGGYWPALASALVNYFKAEVKDE